MTDDTVPAAAVTARRPMWQRIALWIGVAITTLAILLLLALAGLNTQIGKRYVANQIGGYTTESGLNMRVGRIEGSLYGAMVLRDVVVSDPKGAFATAPELAVDWRPFDYLNNHIDVRSVTSPLVRIARLPETKAVAGDPNAPLLPDIDIDIGRIAIDRIEIARAVTGQAHVARLTGGAQIADRRARIVADAATLAAPGMAGGDRMTVRLDAVPDDDRLDLNIGLSAPVGGLVAGLAKLDKPLAFAVDGAGSWTSWRGTARGTLGGQMLADLTLAARSGAVTVRGMTRPGLYLTGPVARLTAPGVRVALDATLNERRMDTRLHLRSNALAVATRGVIDLGKSRFEGFRTEALLLTPGAIADNLNGRSVRAALAIDGPFATPTVDYKISAAALGFGETVVEQFYAEGRATVDADRILVPVTARALRVSGLNAAAGGLLTNVSIAGDLAISGDQLLSDNMRIKSDRIDATAIIVADLGTGRYTGALNGRVNDYEIASIGILNVETNANVYAAPQGGFGIRGRVVAKTSRIFSDGVRSFLGGNAVARADVGMDPDGIIRFANVRLNAPQFRITGGQGSYDPAGPLLFTASGVSNQYGPVTAQVSGTLTAPVALVRAARPGVGLGLANLEARIRGQGDRYAIEATGGSDYGPFSADVLLATAPVLTVDIRSGRVAGMNLNGRLQQTAAGPFMGRVAFAGSGVNGNALLAAQGRYQRADVSARAYNARIPGATELVIGRAIITGSAVLYDDASAIVGDAQVANFRSGDFVVSTGRAKIAYRGGSGTAQLVAQGSSGVPFRIAANARLSPKLWLVAAQGQGNGIGFRTATPARIDVGGAEYRLLPTRIDFDKGSARVAGSYGRGMAVQAVLDRMDLSVLNAVTPGLGVGGSASGSLNFAQAAGQAVPTAQARMTIRGFNRSSIAGVSEGVDIVFSGDLTPAGGDARALIQRGGTTVGRAVAALRPLGGGAGWTERLMNAPLSGGIRYNGPAGVLFSFAGLANQQVSGPIGVAADFGGRVSAPQLTGIVRASNLTYENEIYGTRLTAMKLDGRFTNDRFELTGMTARAGQGSVTAQGSVGLSSANGFPIDIRAELKNAQLARSNALGATASGTIQVINNAQGGVIRGELTIPEARYEVIRQGAAEVAELTGVRRRGDAVPVPGAPKPDASAGFFKLDLRIRADNRLTVTGMGLESEWRANLRVRGTSAVPTVTGTARVVRGTYSFAGKRFELSRGIVTFEGGAISNPMLDIAASTTAEGVTATINIGGYALNPKITFSSSPALPQDEILARLLFGNSVTNLSATEAIQLAAALNSLRGGGGGLNPLGQLRSATGIDRLRILSADEASGRGTALAAGQYLTDDIYVEIITDARGFTATQLEIALTRALSILSQTGSFGGSSVNLRYSRDY